MINIGQIYLLIITMNIKISLQDLVNGGRDGGERDGIVEETTVHIYYTYLRST